MLPEEFTEKMKRLLGAEYDAFAAAYDRPLCPGLRRNPLKQTDADLAEYHPEPIPWAENGFYYDPSTRPGLDPLHDGGAYYLQEPSAMAPAGLLDARPGQRILDLCAAPGGKTTQIACAMRGEGILVCNEINPKRAKILASNVERLGIANALVLNEHPRHLAEVFPSYFDKILVDAPCSGEGMFRKEAAAVTDWSEQTVAMCAARQKEILASAAEMLAPGGRLVYSTCTFSPEENEGSISAFLHTHPEFSVEKVSAPWFAPARPEWIKDPAEGIENTFRLWPHRLRGEGHYAAVLRKRADGERCDCAVQPGEKPPKELAEFCKTAGVFYPSGKFVSFGQRLFLCPEAMPQLRGLKVLRAGLELGEAVKGRFEPAHAWALWLKDAAQTAALSPEDARKYLSGNVLCGTQTGWTLIKYKGISLGWAKGSAGQLKNHYPKALRR